MNQILQVEETKTKKGSTNKKDVILFLFVVIMVFGLILLGQRVYEEIASGNFTLIPSIIKKEQGPKITLKQTEENKLIINVDSKVDISVVSYKWNDETLQTIELNEITSMEKVLNIPSGENTIYVSATDINGKESKEQATYVVEVPKPTIDLSVIGNKIKISVSSTIDLSEITYAWNSETERKENIITYLDRTKFEKEIEIPIGKNTLKIVATDINGSKTEKIQEIKGVTKGITTTTVIGEYWHFDVIARENIQAVEFEFNGQKFLMNTDTFGETKNVHYKVKLIEGNNYLTITSTTESGGTDSTSWEHEYTIAE